VPDGKLERYADFNKHCLKPALDEVNHIMDFIVDVMAVKKGRAVEKLVLSWFRKSPAEMRRAYDEREKSRVGRQAGGTAVWNSTRHPAGRRSEWWIADPGTLRATARIAAWRMLTGADSTCG
jgi:hypothetical protein